jgi:hypothetical protein
MVWLVVVKIERVVFRMGWLPVSWCRGDVM